MTLTELFPEAGKFERMWNAHSFPPHRAPRHAFAQVGRREYWVESNRTGTRWWYQELGDGFAGDGCSRKDWATTTSQKRAKQWITAIESLSTIVPSTAESESLNGFSPSACSLP